MTRKSSGGHASNVKPLVVIAIVVAAALAYDRVRQAKTVPLEASRTATRAEAQRPVEAPPLAAPAKRSRPPALSAPDSNVDPAPDAAARQGMNGLAPATRPHKVRAPFTPSAPPTVGLDDARLALSMLGSDPEAEGVWLAAINDPNLSPHDRKNLIEDLNESGFADPRNLTRADLPLIVARLDLIERHGPDAWDDANAAAFQEAYKDLSAMYDRLMR